MSVRYANGGWPVIRAGVLLAGMLSGTIQGAQLTVTVESANGEPVEHAAVSLKAVEGDVPERRPPRVVIDQQGMQFRPWVTALPQGGSVEFGNNDDITHHVYSFSSAGRFSFRLQSGETRSPMVMDQPGVIILGCNIHDWMVGYIHVADARHAATTDADGTVVFDELPAASWEIGMWHPGLEEDQLPENRRMELAADEAGRITLQLSSPLQETGPREPLDDSGYGMP